MSWEISSPQDGIYNCVAFAPGGHRPLVVADQPASSGTYWPDDGPRAETLDAFHLTLATLGFEPTEDEALVEGVEKIALFAKGSRPCHIVGRSRCPVSSPATVAFILPDFRP